MTDRILKAESWAAIEQEQASCAITEQEQDAYTDAEALFMAGVTEPELTEAWRQLDEWIEQGKSEEILSLMLTDLTAQQVLTLVADWKEFTST